MVMHGLDENSTNQTQPNKKYTPPKPCVYFWDLLWVYKSGPRVNQRYFLISHVYLILNF